MKLRGSRKKTDDVLNGVRDTSAFFLASTKPEKLESCLFCKNETKSPDLKV